MNIPITQIFSIVMLTLLLQASLSSCSGHDEPNLPEVTPQIVFLFSPGGLGDMSYNDCILEGVQHFKKENPGVDLFMYSPDKFEESEKIFTDWVARPASDIPVLFVFASSDYDELVTRELTDIVLPPQQARACIREPGKILRRCIVVPDMHVWRFLPCRRHSCRGLRRQRSPRGTCQRLRQSYRPCPRRFL